MANALEIQQYINKNIKYFKKDHLKYVKTMLEESNKDISEINSIKLKSPLTGVILSVFLGWLGIDRFYSRNYLYGFIKLCTCGLLGIGWFVDWFIIGNSVKTENYINLYSSLGYGSKSTTRRTYYNGVTDALKSKEGKKAIKDLVKSYKDLIDSFSS